MLNKLAFLWTFILALTNVLGFTNISWWIVVIPSIVSIAWLVTLFILAIVLTVVSDSKTKRRFK